MIQTTDRITCVTDTIKDDALVARARGGDPDAFLQLYGRHRDAIFRFAYRLSSSVKVAEDITHDCFLSLVRRAGKSPTPIVSLRNELYSTARTLLTEYFDSSSPEPFVENNAVDETVSRSEHPLKRKLERSSYQVRVAVGGLPFVEREVFGLSEYERLKPIELATIVGTDVEAVTARLKSARQRVRNTLTSGLNRDPTAN